VKFPVLYRTMAELGGAALATGHYAQIERSGDRALLKKGRDTAKDQSYMLYSLSQEILRHTLLPLGAYTKQEIRTLAEERGLVNARKGDSQDICFVPDGDYLSFLERFTGEPSRSGPFLNPEGEQIGTHRGYMGYTIGQRKGLGIALGYPAYVIRIDAEKNEVVLGKDSSLYYHDIFCQDLNFQAIPALSAGESLSCTAKIRYHHAAQPATLTMTGNGEAHLHFDDPVRAPAPGQSAVFYDDENCVIGGGTITRFS
jgi:tRNA-specific 2-thiouridylase